MTAIRMNLRQYLFSVCMSCHQSLPSSDGRAFGGASSFRRLYVVAPILVLWNRVVVARRAIQRECAVQSIDGSTIEHWCCVVVVWVGENEERCDDGPKFSIDQKRNRNDNREHPPPPPSYQPTTQPTNQPTNKRVKGGKRHNQEYCCSYDSSPNIE
jgi:hypothetical protein